MTEQPGDQNPQSPEPAGQPQPAGGGGAGSTTGLDSNVAGGLSYVLGVITGIIFLVLEKEDRYVRFHAAQSTVFSVSLIILWIGLSILSVIVGMIPAVGWIIGALLGILSILVGLGGFILWVVLLIKAFTGNEWEIPVIGEQARKIFLKESAAGAG